MEDSPKSNTTLEYGPDESQTAKVWPTNIAPRLCWGVTPRRDVGQQPQPGHHILAQWPGQSAYAQPGQSVLPGQPGQYVVHVPDQPASGQYGVTVPGQPGLVQVGHSVLLDQLAYAQPGQTNPVQSVMYKGVQPFSVHTRPSYPSPHSHLQFVIITTVFFLILTITSLSLRIPALILAIIANTHLENNCQWKGARAMAHAALYLSIINCIYILGTVLMNLGCLLQFGTYYDENDYDY